MVTFQPDNYRQSAQRFSSLAASLQAGDTDQPTALRTVVDELRSLAGDLSSPTLQALAQTADRFQAAESTTPAAIDDLARTLWHIADSEEQTQARVQNMFSGF